MAPGEDRFNSQDTEKSNFTGKKNKQTKKPQEFVSTFIEKHIKVHETKIPRSATN